MEASTRYLCKQCGNEFEPKSRSGGPREFCAPQCRYRWHNTQRLKGAALLKERNRSSNRGPSRRAQQISRAVFQELVPVAQRADLIRQACANRGITDSATIEAALKRNGCLPSPHVSRLTFHEASA